MVLLLPCDEKCYLLLSPINLLFQKYFKQVIDFIIIPFLFFYDDIDDLSQKYCIIFFTVIGFNQPSLQ